MLLIDLESELRRVQIEYLEKTINLLIHDYSDYNTMKIKEAYEELLDVAEVDFDRLHLYKQYYAALLQYLFDVGVGVNSEPELSDEYIDEQIEVDPEEVPF